MTANNNFALPKKAEKFLSMIKKGIKASAPERLNWNIQYRNDSFYYEYEPSVFRKGQVLKPKFQFNPLYWHEYDQDDFEEFNTQAGDEVYIKEFNDYQGYMEDKSHEYIVLSHEDFELWCAVQRFGEKEHLISLLQQSHDELLSQAEWFLAVNPLLADIGGKWGKGAFQPSKKHLEALVEYLERYKRSYRPSVYRIRRQKSLIQEMENYLLQ